MWLVYGLCVFTRLAHDDRSTNAGLVLALGHLSDHSRRLLLQSRRSRRKGQQQQPDGEGEEGSAAAAPASPAKEEAQGGGEEGMGAGAASFPPMALAGAIGRMYHDDLLPLLPLGGAAGGECVMWLGLGIGVGDGDGDGVCVCS